MERGLGTIDMMWTLDMNYVVDTLQVTKVIVVKTLLSLLCGNGHILSLKHEQHARCEFNATILLMLQK
jgi:hypothetical protein